jgi:hypothetical protein
MSTATIITTETPADAFGRTVETAYRRLYGRPPSRFEIATGAALWRAWSAAEERGEESPRFEWLSVAVGGGKSTAALALLAHLATTEGRPCVYVVRELTEINNALHNLRDLVPASVSVWGHTSIHGPRVNASMAAAKEAECTRELYPSCTERDLRSADIIVTTHESWREAVVSGCSPWLLTRDGERRATVVDEHPDIDRTYVAQPEDVGALASLFADTTCGDDARVYGLGGRHPLDKPLRSIQERMEAIKAQARGDDYAERGGRTALSSAELVTDDELRAIQALDGREIVRRVSMLGVPPAEAAKLREELPTVVEFLKAAGEGRVFYCTDGRPAFHAYAMAIPPVPHCVVLDGTAELSELLKAASSHVHLTEDLPRPDYSAAELHHVFPPDDLRDLLRKKTSARPGIYGDYNLAVEWFRWFMGTFIEEHTQPDEEILVYCKMQLLDDYKLPLLFDESGGGDFRRIEYRGRVIHFEWWGRGYGSNRWKEATVYVQLGSYELPRAVYVTKAASITGAKLEDADLRAMSAKVPGGLLKSARESWLACRAKQDAARTALRRLDDDGRCPPVRLYFVEANRDKLLDRKRKAMFPGAKPYRHVSYRTEPSQPTDTGPDRVLRHLATTEERLVTFKDLEKAAKVSEKSVRDTMKSPQHVETIEGMGWKFSRRIDEGLKGKGRCLVRRPETDPHPREASV